MPINWKGIIEKCDENYTILDSDSEEYLSLFKDRNSKISVKVEVVEKAKSKATDNKDTLTEETKVETISVPISNLKQKFKVFRINNMELFTAFNSVLYFYKCQGREDLYKLESVYYKFKKCYAVERIINSKLN